MCRSLKDALRNVSQNRRDPLDSQVDAAHRLRNHGRLIARLPTGAGKTMLAALPFAAGQLTPRQMVFMTPLRTLASAQAGTLRKEIAETPASAALGRPWEVREQTGNVPDDPLFESPAVVCTFDQAMSSALQISYSTSKRRRTVNADAILSSYLVADELHLFPQDQALTTLLWMLRHRPDLPFCLMTATLSSPFAIQLSELLGADVVSGLPDEDVAGLKLAERTRRLQWQPEAITPEQIAALSAQHPRLLVVVNTVNRAIELGRCTRELSTDRPVRVLHSRYYREDRDRITEEVLDTFGKGSSNHDHGIVIATQAIEAGVDLSADMLLTELAPANALVQRWGRCARWGGHGEVVVAEPVKPRAFPYGADHSGQQLIERTRSWLQEHASQSIQLDDDVETNLLETVHAPSDEAWLHGLERALADRSGAISRAIQEGDYTLAGTLIRHVDQRTVLVHGAPEELGKPTRYEGFGLAQGTIQGVARKMGLGAGATRPAEELDVDEDLVTFDLHQGAPDWVFQVPVWDPSGSERRADEPVTWRRVQDPAELRTEPLIVLNPTMAQYDPSVGFVLEPGPTTLDSQYWAPPVEPRMQPFTRSGYKRETFEQHIERMLRVVFDSPVLWPRIESITDRIEQWLNWPPGTLERVVRATVILHDAGKLTPAWQEAIRQHQVQRGYPVEPWLVHSDSEADEKRPATRFPPHALSGAAHALDLACDVDEEIVRDAPDPGGVQVSGGRVLITAVATHHTPVLRDCLVTSQVLLDDAGKTELCRVLEQHRLPRKVPNLSEGVVLDDFLVPLTSLGQESVAREVYALTVVTRLLRLADGWSQELARGE